MRIPASPTSRSRSPTRSCGRSTGPGTADLDDEQYDTAVTVLGERAVFELSTLVGYYATLALQMRVFRVGGAGLLTRTLSTGAGTLRRYHPGQWNR